MRKNLYFLFAVFLILQFSFLHAAQIETKTSFAQEETLVAKATGNFYDTVKKENVFLYRKHTRVPFSVNVKKINNDYYLYGDLTNKIEGNYSIVIEDTKYFVLDELLDEKIFANFTISNSTADFSVKPAAIVANKSFSIQLKNLKNSPFEISYSFSDKSSDDGSTGFFSSLFGLGDNKGTADENSNMVSLDAGETKDIEISLGEFTKNTLVNLNLKSENTIYDLPVYVLESTVSEKKGDVYFDSSDLNITLPTESTTNRIVYLKNQGDSTEDITLDLSDSLKPYIEISPSEKALDSNKTLKIDLIISSASQEFFASGDLIARFNNNSDSISIYIYSVEDFVPSETEQEDTVKNNFCSDFGGIICDTGFSCSLEPKAARDGVCCLGTCVKETKNPAGKIIGWSLIIVLILIALWFYFVKFKKVKSVPEFTFVLKNKEK